MVGLEEVKSTVLLTSVRADAPLAVAIHVLPTGVDHGAAPGQALGVACHSAGVMLDPQMGEREDTGASR